MELSNKRAKSPMNALSFQLHFFQLEVTLPPLILQSSTRLIPYFRCLRYLRQWKLEQLQVGP